MPRQLSTDMRNPGDLSSGRRGTVSLGLGPAEEDRREGLPRGHQGGGNQEGVAS